MNQDPMPMSDSDKELYSLLSILCKSIVETQSILLKVLNSGDPYKTAAKPFLPSPEQDLRRHLDQINITAGMIKGLSTGSMFDKDLGLDSKTQVILRSAILSQVAMVSPALKKDLDNGRI